jgi:N-acetylglutamate synthase
MSRGSQARTASAFGMDTADCLAIQEGGADMRYLLEVRLTSADVGQRVVIRWRRPARGGGEVVADVLGILEKADAGSFEVRTHDGNVVVVPARRALAGKVVPPPARRRRGGPAPR